MRILFLVLALLQQPLDLEDATRTYYPETIPGMKTTRHTHVVVEGIVLRTYYAGDGDLHIRIQDDQGNRLTCEAIPGLKVLRPRSRSRVKIYGISRIDTFHKWPEIHPVEKVEVIAPPPR